MGHTLWRIPRACKEIRMSAAWLSQVELPCTAGFPVVWSSLLAESGVEGSTFAGLLAAYLLVYLLDKILVLAVAIVTLRMSRMQETHGRTLKLVGGMVMLALGIVMLVAPGMMESLGGSLLVIGLALAGALGVLAVGGRRAAGGPANSRVWWLRWGVGGGRRLPCGNP